MARVGVVIPASDWSRCPFEQANAVSSQLDDDQLVVVLGPHLDEPATCTETLEALGAQVVVRDATRNAATARNAGVAALDADLDVVLFCDADDRVTPDWVARMTRALREEDADVVGGSLRLTDGRRTRGRYTPRVDYGYRQSVVGGNMGLTRESWDVLGGFDESLHYVEDMDIAWRAPDHGLEVSVRPEIEIEYRLRSPVPEMKQRYRWGRWAVKLFQKHDLTAENLPGLRALYEDKRATRFASNPLTAAVAQWCGQTYGRHADGL